MVGAPEPVLAHLLRARVERVAAELLRDDRQRLLQLLRGRRRRVRQRAGRVLLPAAGGARRMHAAQRGQQVAPGARRRAQFLALRLRERQAHCHQRNSLKIGQRKVL